MSIVELKPKIVFDIFSEINQVPRPSKHEEKIGKYLLNFAQENKLKAKQDGFGNVLIYKPATPGFENRKTTVIQSHMDMVCEKNANVDFDFTKDAIQTEIKGEWLCAKGTTLGADDGIGMAMALAILKSKDLEHGALECLFTTDEETGLGGAIGLSSDFLSGDILINLDSEDEGQLFVSCAGGSSTKAVYKLTIEEAPKDFFFFKIGVRGLTGGHSGDDINKNRANANKLLLRFLYNSLSKYKLYLAEIQSGGLHNAIPREGFAICAVPMEYKEQLRIDLNILASEVEDEYSATEKNIEFYLESWQATNNVYNKAQSDKMIASLFALHNGVYAMSQDMAGLVETSSNLASIHSNNNEVLVITSQRSALNSARNNMSAIVRATFELGDAEATTSDGYPGWKMNPNSEILRITKESYERLFKKSPLVLAIHAGLECGLFSEKYPHLDMISFGPTLRGVHSPDEKLLIPTVDLVWLHLLDVLKNIPAK